MTSRNDVTGDPLISKNNSDSYRSNWDRIFGKKEQAKSEESSETNVSEDSKGNTPE